MVAKYDNKPLSFDLPGGETLRGTQHVEEGISQLIIKLRLNVEIKSFA